MDENLPIEEPLGPRVSAVLVSVNQIESLRRALTALERSTDRERLEILVVDLGSEDGSSQIDTEFPAIVMLRLPHNFGATKAMNIGTRTAKADLIFYMSPDIEVEPDTVKKLADKLDEDLEASAVVPLLVDASGKTVSRVYKLPTADTLKSGLAPVPIDTTQETVNVEYASREALLVRKQFVKGMNYFDERYGEFWADADLAAQIRRAAKKIKLYPSIKAVKRADTSPDASKGLMAADKAGGAAAFIGKYYGFMGGLGFRMGSIFRALGRFDFKQLIAAGRSTVRRANSLQ
jgi:GT2 family glycosyltransferase